MSYRIENGVTIVLSIELMMSARLFLTKAFNVTPRLPVMFILATIPSLKMKIMRVE